MNTSPDTFACRMFCRSCGYALIGLPSHRCPECGQEFDPANPSTFLARPRRHVLRRIIQIVLVLLGLTLPLDGYVGYLAWQVHRENKAIEILRANGADVLPFYFCDTTPSWAKLIFNGHAAWLWARTEKVGLSPQSKNVAQSIAAMATFKYLDTLDLHGSNPSTPAALSDRELAPLKNLKTLHWLDLSNTRVSGTGPMQLQALTALQSLELSNTQVTNEGLAQLKGLTALIFLDLSDNQQITDAGLANLKNLAALEYLDLSYAQASDAGLAQLKNLTRLRSLSLSNTNVTDAGLAQLKGVNALQSLYLEATPVTGAGLSQLKGISGLQALDLGYAQVTNAGLSGLKGLTTLDTLCLQGTHVTDAGLAQLKGLTGLKFLNLGNTNVTDAGVTDLQKALPACEILPPQEQEQGSSSTRRRAHR